MNNSSTAAPATSDAHQQSFENARLLLSNGAFPEDYGLSDGVRLVVLPSPPAQALTISIDTSVGHKMPSRVIVLSGSDVNADSIHRIAAMPPVYELLLRTGVRHLGECVMITHVWARFLAVQMCKENAHV